MVVWRDSIVSESVLFNHACRYELFDRNPIYLVRQSAKRRRAPTVLMPAEIKALVDNLSIRERTLVLLAAFTGLRQSEIFGLKWEDIDFTQGNMSVTRSIVYGVVGSCKIESSQKPVSIHPLLADALLEWRKDARYTGTSDPAQIHWSCGFARWSSEAIRMAHVPSHLLDSAPKCRN
jgi:integrase